MGTRRTSRGLWRKRGFWYTRVRLPDGELQAVSLRTKDYEEALARRAMLVTGVYVSWHPSGGPGRRLSEVVERWLGALEVQGTVSEATLSCYRQRSVPLVSHLGGRSVVTLGRSDVEVYVEGRLKEASRATVSKELTVLRRALWYGVEQGWMRPGFAVEAVVPRFRGRSKPRRRAPTPKEVQRLLGALPRGRWSYVLLAYAGLRAGEVERAQWGDLEGRCLLVRGTKTRYARRTVWLHREVAACLASLRGDAGPEEAMVPRWSNVRRDLAAACRRAGIERLSPNDLRRGCATSLRAAGTALDVVARHLGHAPGSRVTSEFYAPPPPAELERAVEQVESPLPEGTEVEGLPPEGPEPPPHATSGEPASEK